jgi:AcrR family transcriptional regulator
MDKNERRQQILELAREVFAKRGYHDAKIEDIVTAAGVARGTFYLYFDDKRAVFEEIVDRAFTRIGMAIVRVDPRDKGRSVAEQIQENINRLVTMLLDEHETTKILLTGAMGVDPAFDRKLHAFYEVVEKLLEESLSEGQELGMVRRADPKMLTYLTMGALKEVLYHEVVRDGRLGKDAIVAGVFEFLRHGCLRVD